MPNSEDNTDEVTDEKLWSLYIRDVKRLTPAKPPASKKEAAKPPRKKRAIKETIALILPDIRPFSAKAKTATGLDGHTRKKLDKGEIPIAAKLDLHGYTQERAYNSLLSFVTTHHAAGSRLILIITGKGANSKPTDIHETSHKGGVLQSLVPEWLKSDALSRFVIEVRHANKKHGGEGALYVYLKKIKKS